MGIHGIRKFECYELREQVCITPQWEMIYVVSLIGVELGFKWNMLLNENSICYFHCGAVLRIGDLEYHLLKQCSVSLIGSLLYS